MQQAPRVPLRFLAVVATSLLLAVVLVQQTVAGNKQLLASLSAAQAYSASGVHGEQQCRSRSRSTIQPGTGR